jgi:hypothetical protein
MRGDTAEWRDKFKVKLHPSLDILRYSLLRQTSFGIYKIKLDLKLLSYMKS